MISIERMEMALKYLAETDDKFAYHKAHAARTEHKAKAIKQAVFLRCDGTVAERTAKAEDSDEYKAAMDNYFEALREAEHVKNKRATESIVIEVWRSLNSSRNKGNIV